MFAKNSIASVGFVCYLMYIKINLVFKTIEHYKKAFFADFAALTDKPKVTSMFSEDTVFVVFSIQV